MYVYSGLCDALCTALYVDFNVYTYFLCNIAEVY